MVSTEQLHAHADRIRASAVLGRSALMQKLFDFLMECSATDKAPKEIEIAIDVFGKDARFEVAQDAMVRVYIHKLRRKLEDYYAGPGREETGRLTIPRGEYRLVFEEIAAAPNVPVDATSDIPSNIESAQNLAVAEPVVVRDMAVAQSKSPRTHWPRHWRYLALGGLAALLVANLLVWFLAPARSSFAQELDAVRATPVWRDMVADDKPITIAVGDYYIFGELGTPTETSPESVQRLVREFAINSRGDLERFVKDRPELADRYMDVALRYLPVSAAFALRDVVQLLEPNKKNPRQVQLVLASDLTVDMIRSTHVVYVGLLSGMGMLHDIAFAGSQFKMGESYDELLDRKTNKLYVSQVNAALKEKSRYRDYGYFSTFAGPSGCRIVILAGTRDAALMHTAEVASRADTLRELAKRTGSASDFEALYAVEGMDQINLDGQLVAADKLDTARIWTRETDTIAAASTTTAQLH